MPNYPEIVSQEADGIDDGKSAFLVFVIVFTNISAKHLCKLKKFQRRFGDFFFQKNCVQKNLSPKFLALGFALLHTISVWVTFWGDCSDSPLHPKYR